MHGVVKNAVTGEPLPRALVQLNSEAGPGALTDGDGRFELTVTGVGLHMFQLTKPGFHDLPSNLNRAGTSTESNISLPHNVFVSQDMPGISFTLSPTSAIYGHIDLSTGDTAQGIGVQLLRRIIQGGRSDWRMAANTRTNSDGAFRFAGLDDGDYAIETEPAKDSDVAGNLVTKEGEGMVASSGYAVTYYPDAREFSGAARIHLRGGDSVQANFTLKLEPFHLISAKVIVPAAFENNLTGNMVTSELLDADGRHSPYGGVFGATPKTFQAMVPDGAYRIHVSALKASDPLRSGTLKIEAAASGQVDVSVAGHAVTGIRIPVGAETTNPLQAMITRTNAQPQHAINAGQASVFVSISQAGPGLTDGMASQYAQGPIPGMLETTTLLPGKYWVHTSIGEPGLCESSFTAGGANLALEPLTIGPGGTSAPLALTLRDDCATLKLSLPPNLAPTTGVEEPAYSAYVVPDFASTVYVSPVNLRASDGGSIALDNLTPGNYHVYVFTAPVELEYHNPESLAALGGNAVTLEPSSTSTLIVEVPAP